MFISLLSIFLIGCKYDLQPIEINAYSGQKTVINLKETVEEYPTDEPVYFYIKSNPKYGKLSGELPQVTYTSDQGYVGTDTFKIYATYKGKKSNSVSIKIIVEPNLSEDRDNDRVKNVNDAFPDDPSEIYDTDNNGIGNYKQVDEDDDGAKDQNDAYPFNTTKKDLIVVNEKEFNDNLNDATLVSASIPFRVKGAISQSVDIDVYQLTIDDPTELTIVLKKDNTIFSPSISVFDEQGEPLDGATKTLNEQFTGFHVKVESAGNYYFQITDANSKFSSNFTYEADLFVDADFDYVSDNLEKALGSNTVQSDSDGDGIIDFYEITLAINSVDLDVDNDGIPNWLDTDADGNGIVDGTEGIDDLDNDGIPNFLDTDNDGNGIADIEEIGNDPKFPVDTDSDTIPDYIDIDDDGDALYDNVDPDRLTAIRFSDELDINDRLIITDIRYYNDEYSAENILVPNKSISLTGVGFANDSSAHTVALKLESGGYVLSPVTSLNGDVLTFTMPDVIATQLFVIRNNNVRSATKNIQTSVAKDPILFQPKLLAVEVGKRYSLFGENFTNASIINTNGVSITPTYISNSRLDLVIPSTAQSGVWSIITENGKSNSIKLEVVKASNVNISVANNYPLALNSLVISNDSFEEYAVDNNGNANVTINQDQVGFLDVFANWKGAEGIALQAITLPTDQQIIINSASTATAMALEMSLDFSALSISEAAAIRQQVNQLPEVIALTQVLDTQIATNPLVASSSDKQIIAARIKAMEAATKVVQSQISVKINNASADLPMMARAAMQPLPDGYEPEITPEQYDIKVNAQRDNKTAGLFGGDLTGDVEVENDTQLYLSTKITNLNDGSLLYPHVQSYLDGSVVKPQSKIFFDAYIKKDYGQCNFSDCKVEIASKSSSSIDAGASRAGSYVMTRTVVERIAVPIVQKFIGSRIDDSELYVLIVAASPVLIDTIYNDLNNSSLSDEEKVKRSGEKIATFILRDFFSNGPLSKYIQKKLSIDVGEEIAKQIIIKAGLKAVPYVNAVSLGYDVIKFGLVSRNISLAVADLSTVPAKIEFDVVWPLEVFSFTPLAHDVEDGSVTIKFEGIGLQKVANSYAIGDNGFGTSIATTLSGISANGRQAGITLTESELIDLENNVEFSFFEQGASTGKSPEEVLELTAKLVIKKLEPDTVAVNDQLCVIGSGYSNNNADNRVHLMGEDGDIILTPSTASSKKLCLTVPQKAISGDIFVTVDKDQTGLEKSNTAYLTVLKSDIAITFGDNGSANDDTFALFVNGQLIHSMSAPARSVGPFKIDNLKAGVVHTIQLRGITAPDAVGTYYIEFSGNDIDSIEGDSYTGSDLTAGASKTWKLLIMPKPKAATRTFKLNFNQEADTEVPIIWQE